MSVKKKSNPARGVKTAEVWNGCLEDQLPILLRRFLESWRNGHIPLNPISSQSWFSEIPEDIWFVFLGIHHQSFSIYQLLSISATCFMQFPCMLMLSEKAHPVWDMFVHKYSGFDQLDRISKHPNSSLWCLQPIECMHTSVLALMEEPT